MSIQLRKHIRTAIGPAMLLCLALNCGLSQAANIVGGDATNRGEIEVSSSDIWTVLRTVQMVLPATDSAAHNCMITASADLLHPALPAANRTGVNLYHLTVSLNTASPSKGANGAERSVEINETAVDDPDTVPVTTNLTVRGLRNNNGVLGTAVHEFRLLARKDTVNVQDLDVSDSSLSFVCTEGR